jgi:hypothetical protein
VASPQSTSTIPVVEGASNKKATLASLPISTAAQTALDLKTTATTLAASDGSALVGFIQAGTGAVARTVEEELRRLAICPEQFGAAEAYDAGVDDTSFVNAACDVARLAGRGVKLSRMYSTSNVLFGDQATGAQASAPVALIGNGINSGFKVRSGTTGVAVKAWSTSGVVYEGWRIDCDDVAGVTIAFDTEWKPGSGPSQHNEYRNLWIENYPAMGWNRVNNNECVADGVIVRSPTTPDSVGGTQVAIDAQASGGNVIFENCAWPDAVMDLCAQNATFNGSWGMGIRLNKDQTGNNFLHFNGGQTYSNKYTLACVSDNAVATAGHWVRAAVCSGHTFLPTVAGHSLFDIGLASRIVLNASGCDSAIASNFWGANAASKAGSGRPQVVLNGLSDIGAGALTLNAVSGIDYQSLGRDVDGVVSGDVGPVDYTPSLSGITLGDGSVEGRYSVTNGVCNFMIRLVMGSTTSVTGVMGFGLPLASSGANRTNGSVWAEDIGTGYKTGLAVIYPGVSAFNIFSDAGAWNATVPFTWANTDTLQISGFFYV